MKRKIVSIDQTKCNGCGLCVDACHEQAITLVAGKAQLVSDEYCDGLGDCLPACPEGAIEIVEREAVEFSEQAVQERSRKLQAEEKLPCGCPISAPSPVAEEQGRNWPIQIQLVNPTTKLFANRDLLIAADCTAFANPKLYEQLHQGKAVLIACPKLDDYDYVAKLGQILSNHAVKSVTVVRMEVPCCRGIVEFVKQAMLQAGQIVPYQEIVIGVDGQQQ